MHPSFEIKFIKKENIQCIIPLLSQLNEKESKEVLANRVTEMAEQNYKCLGIYDGDKLIGICGLWFMTRHYCGKSIEPDHIFIDPNYQSMGIGKQLFDWIFDYADHHKLEALELNTYVRNTRSHKFYYNLGFEILGFHFVKRTN